MFKLESNRLKREFKISNDSFYASQIFNKYSNMSLVPDGNGCEFIVHFENGEEFSSKGLPVVSSSDDNDKLSFTFKEWMGVSVTLEYWVHKDKNTICKQVTLNQSTEDVVEYVILESVGIINSKTHFSVDVMEDSEIDGVYASLGQPFYVDSLFFGCEFPATDNRIIHGTGQIKYYVGKAVDKNFACPVTVMGGACDNTMQQVQRAFFEYIDFISTKTHLRFQYNSWYDHMLDINAENIEKSFYEIEKGLSAHGVAPLDAYVVDDGWNNYKGNFWSFNNKFPNEMYDVCEQCKKMNSHFGMWLGPRGGYDYYKKFAKRIEKSGKGYFNKQSRDICVASRKYLGNLEEFLIDQTKKFDVDYWKLDGFCLKPCKDSSHDHMTGGENDMYFVTDMWHKWIKLLTNLRESRLQEGKSLWINMTCYVNVSPWWLQWVNSIWLQNSKDIGFAENYEEQPRVEAEITYRDGKYFDCICRRANQIPLKNIYNHEPIYGNTAKIEYTDDEFKKFVYWCAVRGQALNEFYLSYNMMNDSKWESLSNVINWQKSVYHVLQKATFIGGDPCENNIYGYISWTEDGEGVIALRNPTKEKASLTLTLNKLMGVPETLKDVRVTNIYNKSMPQSEESYSYNDKINLNMHPFEVMIFQFGK